MLLSAVVDTSKSIAQTSKRLQKIDLMARLLKQLRPEEIEIVVPFLSGRTRQGKIGIGHRTLSGANAP
ncbi:MAG TPA: ATP-dependent DNA ligase, partial [Bryobacteraceae bacterium]